LSRIQVHIKLLRFQTFEPKKSVSPVWINCAIYHSFQALSTVTHDQTGTNQWQVYLGHKNVLTHKCDGKCLGVGITCNNLIITLSPRYHIITTNIDVTKKLRLVRVLRVK